MSYNKYTWRNGDVITESKLNHIETGIDEAHDAIDDLEVDALTNDIKQALLNCFANVAWINDDGQEYYDALENALYPPVQLYSINAVYTQSGAVYTTDTLESLKSDLVVTALYDDATTEVITDYTLSGTLTAGTSTITVSYEGKTDTFNVTVTEIIINYIDAVFTQGQNVIYDTDSLDDLKQYLVVTAYYSDSTSAVVSDYILSGTLTEGTSTITVTYNGLIDTFDVTVSHGSVLPSGYTQYDYIYNSASSYKVPLDLGTQYADSSYEIGVEFSVPNLTANTSSSPLYCLRENSSGSANSRAVWVQGKTGQNNLSFHLANTDTGFCYELAGGTKYTVVTKDKKAYVNGNLVATVAGNENVVTTGTFKLFAQVSAGSDTYAKTVYRVYSFWVKDANDNYVAYMLPCVRDSDGHIGMYDVIREAFYQGTPLANGHVGNDE